jgi:multimeric flavodoxin WrbA
MKHLLIVYSSQTGNTEALVRAAAEGAAALADEVETRVCVAFDAGVDELLWADGLIIGTPENFGYMSGAVKDFMDRTYYPVEGKVDALPYMVLVSSGNDGRGAVSAIERIANGYNWKRVDEALIVRGVPQQEALAMAHERGEAMATALSAGIY